MMLLTNVLVTLTFENRLTIGGSRAKRPRMIRRKRSLLRRVRLSYCLFGMLRLILVLLDTGLQNLRRYFELVVFQAYLQSTIPDTMQSFQSIEAFVKAHPVIKTFEKEIIHGGISALQPLAGAAAKGDMASPDEVTQVVVNRDGSILSASTILKSDFFSNLQKLTLLE